MARRVARSGKARSKAHREAQTEEEKAKQTEKHGGRRTRKQDGQRDTDSREQPHCGEQRDIPTSAVQPIADKQGTEREKIR